MIKRISIITMVVLMLLSAFIHAEAAEQDVVMEIKGMSCNLWPVAVKKSLEGIKGVRDVKVSFEKEKAWLTADESVTDDMLVESVRKAGYFGKVIERKKGGNK